MNLHVHVTFCWQQTIVTVVLNLIVELFLFEANWITLDYKQTQQTVTLPSFLFQQIFSM